MIRDPYPTARYDPWRDLATNWPEVAVRVIPLPGDLLGVLRYPSIALRAGTSAAQRRSTLAHEIVHLERGTQACGPGDAREEALVEAEAARRLVAAGDLARAIRELGNRAAVGAVAALLDVDTQLLRARLAGVTAAERTALEAVAGDGFTAA
ncbi:hypothetical protein [Jatrophihabitans endophyticus]|uniref:hypothetical protein n=1 Tax=Jatrophihabitans endophyticus TaxID=1206085 RepID=UPI0009FD371A|nr:hypothetical protein [Jatrophihabitans endophyticus]